jgi:hypothetical protein
MCNSTQHRKGFFKMIKEIFELLVFAGLLAMVMIWGIILGA